MSASYEYCRFERDGHVVTITLDRPEVLNALNPAAHRELAHAFDAYAADPELRVAIVTGAGDRAFCVGTDLKALAQTGDHAKPATGFAGITHRFDLWKPVIAAVNGLCLGGGVEVLSACDLAVAAEHAQFGLSEPRVGLAALGGERSSAWHVTCRSRRRCGSCCARNASTLRKRSASASSTRLFLPAR